ncbi:MAG: Stf0 family sulfotransferase, partial [Actinomycetota bacterium]
MSSGIATYVICTSPRSGSTLLCTLLASTGVAGNPDSWFHRPSLDDWARGLGVDGGLCDETPSVSRLLRAARDLGSGHGDMFG